MYLPSGVAAAYHDENCAVDSASPHSEPGSPTVQLVPSASRRVGLVARIHGRVASITLASPRNDCTRRTDSRVAARPRRIRYSIVTVSDPPKRYTSTPWASAATENARAATPSTVAMMSSFASDASPLTSPPSGSANVIAALAEPATRTRARKSDAPTVSLGAAAIANGQSSCVIAHFTAHIVAAAGLEKKWSPVCATGDVAVSVQLARIEVTATATAIAAPRARRGAVGVGRSQCMDRCRRGSLAPDGIAAARRRSGRAPPGTGFRRRAVTPGVGQLPDGLMAHDVTLRLALSLPQPQPPRTTPRLRSGLTVRAVHVLNGLTEACQPTHPQNTPQPPRRAPRRTCPSRSGRRFVR